MDNKQIGDENRRRLIEYFESGSKGPDACGMLGVELEHHVVTDDGGPVSYEPVGSIVGVRDILDYLRPWYPEESLNARHEILGLAGEEGSVTLEPAAQLELSAAPYARVDEVARAFQNFYQRVNDFLAPRGAHLESLGYHATRRAQELTLIPKRRYVLMDAYFAHIKSHGDRMMRASASTQVSVDFADEADAVRKMRVASVLSPILAAIADNAPVFEGEPNHVPIRRLQLWREVDHLRCGTVPGVFEEGFGFAIYADWLLATPPIFVTRAAAADPTGPAIRPFFDVPASEAYADAPMETPDVEHLISMFWPDVRLKRFVEIRPADSLPLPLTLGYVALVKGIFYSEASLAAIERTLGVDPATATTRGSWPLSTKDVDDAIGEVQTRGLEGELFGETLAFWEHLLFSLARASLDEGEATRLAPLERFCLQKPWWHLS